MRPATISASCCLRAHLLHSVRLLIWLTCVSIAPPLGALAQTNTPAPLPPAAQEALNKGIIAAKAPDYLLAIRYFEAARKAAPDAPVIYLNMGLAESRIPGRELRAMAWFGAYLAAYPDAPNAAAVKEQMAVLDVNSQVNVSRLLTSLQAAASQLSDKDGDRSNRLWQTAGLWLDSTDIARAQKAADLIRFAEYKARVLINIAEAKLAAGDIAGAKNSFAAAQKIADRIDTEPSFAMGDAAYHKGQRLADIVEGQAKSGDIDGAQRTVDLIKSDYASRKSPALSAIAAAQIKAGDNSGAQKTLNAAQKNADLIVEDPYRKCVALGAIAEVQLKAGDIAGAQKTFATALKTIELIEGAYYKSMALCVIAEDQTSGGDIPGALKTLASAQEAADLIKDTAEKSNMWSLIAEIQANAGDIAGAKKSLTFAQNFTDLIQGESYRKNSAQGSLARVLAKIGDIAAAQKYADLIQDAFYKSWAQEAIEKAQAKADIAKTPNSPRQATSASPIQPVIKVSAWLKKLDDSDKINDCPLNTAPFLDLADYLKSLPESNDPNKLFDALYETAKTIVKAQNVIQQMLKQRAQ